MLGKRGYNTMGKKGYAGRPPCADLTPTDLESMGDSKALQEATAAKEEEGKRAYEAEAQVHIDRQRKLEEALAEKERQLQSIIATKKRESEEEEKKRQAIPMDMDSMPSDHILLPPTYANAPKQAPVVHQLSVPLASKQKVYYTQILGKK